MESVGQSPMMPVLLRFFGGVTARRCFSGCGEPKPDAARHRSSDGSDYRTGGAREDFFSVKLPPFHPDPGTQRSST